MTESEWLLATPPLMMHHIKQVCPASIRTLRLLAVAWTRYLETLSDYADSKHVSHLGEEVVEGRQSLDDLWEDSVRGWGFEGDWSIANCVLAANDGLDNAIRTSMHLSEDRGQKAGLDVSERPVVARLLIQCVLGNPFRSVEFSPDWLTSTVVTIARTMYDSRYYSPMLLLADALQDAGCENEDILNHCRSGGPHVRGCWVVDLILGKE
ncbi:MAG: hypothetical protein U0791_04565 [Gemmataceae bacterium]